MHGYSVSSKICLTISQMILSKTSSQRIYKLRVLPIGQIQPLLVLKLDIRRSSTNKCFLRVLPSAIPVDEQHVQQTDTPAGDDHDLSRHVTRSVFGPESLRADDVADARDRSKSAKVVLRSPVVGDGLATYQYPIRYRAATVVFLVYPATLLLIRDNNATNGVGDAWVR